MLITRAIAPPYQQLRPMKPVRTATFPVYPGLVDRLLAPQGHPDPVVAHVLATCAGYAYSDAELVSTILARLGLEENHTLCIAQSVDVMFIRSTAYLVQSACGRCLLLCYRGTEPMNFINWLTDADVNPEKVQFALPGSSGAFAVHGGFYRNVRATRYEVVAALQRALAGQSVAREGEAMEHPLEAIYVAGHSLGAAMAAMLGIMLVTEPAYAPLAAKLRGIYTYGQPMVGDPPLATACGAHAVLGKLVRYIYGHDVVAELPPSVSGDFAHFGQEYRFDAKARTWSRAERPTEQLRNLLDITGAAGVFFAHQLRWLRDVPFRHSLYDHGPQHYIAALTPPGVRSEFGD